MESKAMEAIGLLLIVLATVWSSGLRQPGPLGRLE
jgi:hypothetical protein